MELVLLISQVLGGGTALGHPHEPPVTVEGLLWLVQDILCQSHTKTIPQALTVINIRILKNSQPNTIFLLDKRGRWPLPGAGDPDKLLTISQTNKKHQPSPPPATAPQRTSRGQPTHSWVAITTTLSCAPHMRCFQAEQPWLLCGGQLRACNASTMIPWGRWQGQAYPQHQTTMTIQKAKNLHSKNSPVHSYTQVALHLAIA
ncbi:hypothetical protein E2C01_019593 [Portunus trituberculatus]|uniref:Uncharacterized protein n=1 Tax=Portunus trituberculatus TaxID=210409 RepID=A0A5B7E0V7_PORTR|nr:hypothetical protein [Portunus trituberculatus]